MKKLSQSEKVEKLIKENMKPNQSTITDCSFVGVKFDKEAVDAVSLVAEGLIENAKALGCLAKVLNASNVNIEAMLRIDGQQ